ncbi:hypothetical protein KTR66_19495 [Roseococcus sp. SDR]|uniref:hypothetical protein n=1 Tax=Roseococcus sp. SDR TaxID=2835532 RepID=UPI001BCC6B33|nr:hypothetical protein [Roseococcus sp. SDR]MBS7792193.1 hypothetical protein [Roseococcus sp. SDR]MBV1847507.1 hypothetical protein [Roseococcus sp. SDR]
MLKHADLAAAAHPAGLPLLELLRRLLASPPVNLPALDVLIDCAEDGARRAEAEADAATFHTAEQRGERGLRISHSRRAEAYWHTARLARSARAIFAEEPLTRIERAISAEPARELLRLLPARPADLRLLRVGVSAINPALRVIDALITAAELEERGA